MFQPLLLTFCFLFSVGKDVPSEIVKSIFFFFLCCILNKKMTVQIIFRLIDNENTH